MIYVGTCGYAFKDWLGAFYPATTRQTEMLRYYAGCFCGVEIDASYYGILSNQSIAAMIERTPPEFRFCFKVPQTVTHAPDVTAKQVHADASAFVESITPVAQAKKLGCALIQFPNSFKPTASANEYLNRVVDALRPLPLVVEFRSSDWQNSSTHQMLCELGVGWCNVDMPSYASLLHASSDVTCGIGYVRFHGRNAQTWWTGDNTSRYDYDYKPAELEPWTERVAELHDQAPETYAFFNNHARGNAPRNAQMFIEMLRDRYGQAADAVIPKTSPPPAQASLFDD
jgi:uncharacterized protein YecE (DUF72 family)